MKQVLSGSDVDVLLRDIAEVLFAETALGNNARGHRLGQSNRDAGILAIAAEVAPVSDRIEVLRLKRRLGRLGHGRELRTVGPDVGHSCVMIR
jgi:hypothetical protein